MEFFSGTTVLNNKCLYCVLTIFLCNQVIKKQLKFNGFKIRKKQHINKTDKSIFIYPFQDEMCENSIKCLLFNIDSSDKPIHHVH